MFSGWLVEFSPLGADVHAVALFRELCLLRQQEERIISLFR